MKTGEDIRAKTRPFPLESDRPAGLLGRLRRTARFLRDHRLYLPPFWVMALRFVWFKIRNPHIITEGFVFLERGAEVYARPGYGRLTIGRWAWIGRGNAIRCHEGNLRIGNKVVFGRANTINCYLDIDVGDDCIFADWIYVCDFDHRYENLTVPIKKQGIIKSPVKIGADCWIGEKSTVLRGVTIGSGSVVASHALVNRDVPAGSIVGGVPARILKKRGEKPQRT
ncbi:MAG: DapH/DapD/GlmU-related protein [Actinomycetota bacterium]|nr:acyltransferase [Actinomycetota bacterium]